MNTWIELAGWTLLHFLWQGTAAALAGAVLLRLLRTASPRARYTVACVTLGAMLVAPIATATLLYRGPAGSITPAAGAASGATEAGSRAPSAAPRTAMAPPVAGTTQEPPLPALLPRQHALLSVIVMAWLSGVAFLLARLGGGCWRVRTLYRNATIDRRSQWQDSGERLARRLGIARAISIVDSALVDTPTVIGWTRPIILLPAAAFSNLSPGQVEAILAHELAHVRRHDFLVNLLQTLAETLLFYHPGIWWISSRIRAEREHCCDDVAVDVCGDAVAYAAALTELAAFALGRHRLVMAATSGSLLSRVRRLLTPASAAPRSSIALSMAIALGLVLLIGSVRIGSLAQSPDAAAGADASRGFGPPDVNRVLGFELFPGPRVLPTEDPRGVRAWSVTLQYHGGEMPLIGFTARSLIRDAYGLVGTPVIVPDWVDLETFTLAVRADVSLDELRGDPDVIRPALRRLFEDQLGLQMHVESRAFPVYALVRAHADGTLGPGLRPSTAACDDAEALRTGVRLAPRTPFCGFEDGFTGYKGSNVTMAQLADELTGPVSAIRLPLQVVDRTGLEGVFDIDVRLGPLPLALIASKWTLAGAAFAPFGVRTGDEALREQLGLKLEESTEPFDVLVIDRIVKPAT